MSGSRRLGVFSLTACIAYTAAYYLDWPLFRFYLGNESFSFGAQPESAGAPILWYGWLVMAALIGVVCAAIVPGRLASRIPTDVFWMVPAATTIAAFLYELRWFI